MYSGRFSDAVQSYSKLVDQRRDDPMLRCQLAVALMQAGQFTVAERLVEEATTITERLLPASSPVAAACLHLQALVWLNRGREFDRAEDDARKSRDIWKKAGGGKSACLAATLNNLAVLLVLRGDYMARRTLRRGPQHVAAFAGRAGPRTSPPLTTIWPSSITFSAVKHRPSSPSTRPRKSTSRSCPWTSRWRL